MKFKLDENLGAGLALPLARDGHDVSSVLLQRMGGHPDGSVFEACRREGRALITLDLDFNDPITYPTQGTSGIILLRPGKPLLSILRRLFAQLPDCLARERLDGRLWVVEVGRLRIFDPNR